MTTITESGLVLPIEVAYRRPGSTWKRRVIRTEAAFDRFLTKLREDAAEVQTRAAEE